MTNEIVLGNSEAADQDFSCVNARRGCRWGDYAGATPDPVQDTVVWGSNQLMGPVSPRADDPHWSTRNFALGVN